MISHVNNRDVWLAVGGCAVVVAALAFIYAAKLHARKERVIGHASGLIKGARDYERAYRRAAT